MNASRICSLVLALALLPSVAEAARERQLHGVGPEGETVVVNLTGRGGHCHGNEATAVGTWPDGTVLTGCHPQRYSVYQPVLVRWREVRDGRVVERTLEYHGLAVRFVRVGR